VDGVAGRIRPGVVRVCAVFRWRDAGVLGAFALSGRVGDEDGDAVAGEFDARQLVLAVGLRERVVAAAEDDGGVWAVASGDVAVRGDVVVGVHFEHEAFDDDAVALDVADVLDGHLVGALWESTDRVEEPGSNALAAAFERLDGVEVARGRSLPLARFARVREEILSELVGDVVVAVDALVESLDRHRSGFRAA